jgi:RimJ/RimL family protein N-acetyltransferase
MIFRNATPSDVPSIAALETIPEFRAFVGAWPQDLHRQALADPDTAYIVVEDSAGAIAGFAILRSLQSQHKSLELKRIVVGSTNQGIGKRLLEEVLDRAFNEYGAHRVWLDVFDTNARARHIYRSLGFREDGVFREAILRDGEDYSLVLMSMLDREYHGRRTR